MERRFATYSSVWRQLALDMVKEVACILAGKASDDIIKKVEKPLKRSKIKKRSIARKVSAVASLNYFGLLNFVTLRLK